MGQFINTIVKASGMILCSLTLVIAFSDQAYGQQGNFGIESWNTFLSGVEFTPQQNCSLSDIMLENITYSDNVLSPQDGTLELCLAADAYSASAPVHEPGQTIATAGAAINSMLNTVNSEYYFNLSASLQANTEYWLWIYVQSPDGYNQVSGSWSGIYSIQSVGSSCALEVTIDGTIAGANGWNASSYQAVDEATIIPVPEATPNRLLILGSLILMCLGVGKKGFGGQAVGSMKSETRV
jgi:hypothetical protein